jgi:solute:Na+ symporter, SSS family
MPIQLTVFIIYFLVIFAVSYFASKKIKDYKDFFVAGRRLGVPILIGTFLASGIGGNIFFNVHGFLTNFGIVAVIGLGAYGLSFIILGFLAPKINKLRNITLPEMLGKLFDRKTRMLAVVIILIVAVGGLSIQFRAAGSIVSSILDIPFIWAFVVASSIVIAYTLLGGLWSDALTDVFQAVIIIIGILVTVPFLLQATGGFSLATAGIGELNSGEFFNLFTHGAAFLVGVTIVSALFGLVDPDRYQRIFAAKDGASARTSLIWTGVIYTVFVLFALAIAATGMTLFPDITQGETLWPIMIDSLLPTAIGAIVLSALMAVVMSSSDSVLLVVTSIIIRDIMQQRGEAQHQGLLLRRSRWILFILGLIVMLAGLIFSDILETFLFVNLLVISVLLAPTFFGLIWKRTTSDGAFWGGIIGGLTQITLQLKGLEPEAALVPSVVTSVIGVVIISLLTKKTASGKTAYNKSNID